MAIDDKTRTELEAAAFRRLVEHLRARTDVQNIDLMNLAGFCRNCLSNWLKEEADAKGAAMTKDESREAVYGMPYETWKATHQGAATPEQIAAMKKVIAGISLLSVIASQRVGAKRRPMTGSAKQSSFFPTRKLDCFVALLLAMTVREQQHFLLWARCG